jgi:hypothetical protein
MSHPKPANASVTSEEMAALRKAARKGASRSSDPEIVSFSDGREAAAYHAEPVAPPAAVDQTVSNGDVLLSSTLRREVALAQEKPPQVVTEVAPAPATVLLEETVRAPSSPAPAARAASRPWIPIALVTLGAVLLLATVALVVGLSSGPTPAASSAAGAAASSIPTAPPSTATAPAIATTIAPPETAAPAPPSASTAPTPPPPERPHRGNRRPSPPPASSKGGSDGMIVPPL